MKPSLDGVRLKLARADKHLDLLRAHRVEMVELGHRRVVGQYEASSGDYVFRVSGDPPPPTPGVDVSLFAHLLRSSLDNLLWQLILARGGRPRTNFGPKGSGLRPTQFPIYEKGSEFERNAKAETDGVLAEDFAVIQGAQPYQRGPDLSGWHPLALLGHLNNVDKHRYMHPSFASGVIWRVIQPHPGALGIPVGRPYLIAANGYKRLLQANPGVNPFVDGLVNPASPDGSVISHDGHGFRVNDDDPTEVARVFRIQNAPGREPNMEMQPSPTFDVSFTDRERPMTIRDLEEIRGEVHRLVTEFEGAFPK